MGWEEGREACWVLLNIFSPLIISLFHGSFFFFHDGSLLGNADETMQAKMVFELAVSSGAEALSQFTRQVYLGLSDSVWVFWDCISGALFLIAGQDNIKS